MNLTNRQRKIIIELIALLYVLLFVYAAVSKLADFEKFRIQVGQSPILTYFGGIISWSVPILEIVLATGLAFNRFRVVSLYGALGLMTAFTMYIIIILNFSEYIPCSCGGILEQLGWNEHLVFNILFVLLAITAILLHSRQCDNPLPQ